MELEITLEIIVAADFLMNDAKYIGYAEIGIADIGLNRYAVGGGTTSVSV